MQDPGVPERREMLDGERARVVGVDADAVDRRADQLRRRDDRHGLADELEDLLQVAVRGADDDAVHPQREEGLQRAVRLLEASLRLGALRQLRRQQRLPRGPRGPAEAGEDAAAAEVQGPDGQVADRVGPAAAQAARQVVPAVAQLRDGLFDPLPGLVGEVAAGEVARDRLGRDLRVPADVGHARLPRGPTLRLRHVSSSCPYIDRRHSLRRGRSVSK
jgi:hypothetical protein